MSTKKKAKSKKAVLKPALTVRVVCDKGHSLTGLFVIFKLRHVSGESVDAKLVRVVESTSQPGEPPVEGKQGKKKYEKAVREYEKNVAWSQDTPPDPTDRFVLGIVDAHGFLQPTHLGSNPWFDIETGRDPDTYKLSVGETYDVCALRQPSPALARALTRHLNDEATPADSQRYSFAKWGALTRPIEIEGETQDGGIQPIMRLSEDPGDFLPPGSGRYGGWLLYHGMPHQGCEPLAEPVRKLQEDLGKLRYPIGESNEPFAPVAYDPKKRVGGFDGKVQAAVARMQEHVQAGEAFVLTHKDEAHAGKHWVYSIGESFDPMVHVDAKWNPLPSIYPMGVVDEDTAARITHWVDHGLRKPAEILTQSTIGHGIWMLERGVIALDAWSELAKAFGVQYGVRPGSSLRSVSVGAWPGAILNTVHKTGLAVDLAGGASREPSATWPIRYEAHWRKDKTAADALAAAKERVRQKQEVEAQLEATDDPREIRSLRRKLGKAAYAKADARLEKAQAAYDKELADDADGRLGWVQRWRLYGHSDLDVFGAPDVAVESLCQRISAWSGITDSTPEERHSDELPPRGELWHRFLKRFEGVNVPEVEAWLDGVLEPYHELARGLLDALRDPERSKGIIDRYFRKAIVQWSVNAYEGDGGSAGKRYGPTDGDLEFPARGWAKSWVNLTAIGQLCGFVRIGPHSKSIRDQTWLLGPKDSELKPEWHAMASYFLASGDESVDIVYLLSDIATPKADAPQHKQSDTKIVVRRGGEEVATYEPKQIDGDFVKQWRVHVRDKVDQSFYAGKVKAASQNAHGAELAVMLSVSDRGRKLVDAVAELIGGTFADQHFIVVRAGESAPFESEVGQPICGKDLSSALRKALDAFIKKATVTLRELEAKGEEEGGASLDKPKVRKTRAELAAEKKAVDAAIRKLTTDWMIVFQPVFLREPDVDFTPFLAEDEVLLPPGSNAAHLEWWHFDHRSAVGARWGDLLEECGYSATVLSVPRAGDENGDGLPHRGLGYSRKDLSSTPAASAAEANREVENRDQFTPEGL